MSRFAGGDAGSARRKAPPAKKARGQEGAGGEEGAGQEGAGQEGGGQEGTGEEGAGEAGGGEEGAGDEGGGEEGAGQDDAGQRAPPKRAPAKKAVGTSGVRKVATTRHGLSGRPPAARRRARATRSRRQPHRGRRRRRAEQRVLVNGAVADKPARLVAAGDAVVVAGPPPRFVGRGGEKLDAALDRLRHRRRRAVGPSTSGRRPAASPTACWHRGAREVVALDVGHGQLHPRIRDDRRVVVLERTNIRSADAGRRSAGPSTSWSSTSRSSRCA